MSLRAALANMFRDPGWWHKLLIGGLLLLSVLGAPLSAGFVTMSLDNARRGYASPLPMWVDLGGLYVIGVLSMLIPTVFFVLPAGAALLAAVLAGLAAGPGATQPVQVVIGLLLVWWLCAFLLGLGPVGRLVAVDSGQFELALGVATPQRALGEDRRALFAARLRSLPAYLPALALLAAVYALGPGLAGLVVVWLVCSALFGAHLVVVQLYAATPRR